MSSVYEDTVERQTRTATKALPAQWVVLYRGEEIGLLERWKGKDSPWQAYHGIGMGSKYLGAFGAIGRAPARNALLKAAGIID